MQLIAALKSFSASLAGLLADRWSKIFRLERRIELRAGKSIEFKAPTIDDHITPAPVEPTKPIEQPPEPRVEPDQESLPPESDQTQAPAEDYEENYNRAQRRALERARRRHDKFVEPKGELPEPIIKPRSSRPKPNSKPDDKPSPSADDDFHAPDAFEKPHEVSGEKVLYHLNEALGEFAFRDTILDQLDRYWVYLKRMRKHDPEAYEFYRRLGGQILPYAATGLEFHAEPEVIDPANEKYEREELEQFKKDIYLPQKFLHDRPSFGCVAFATSPAHEKREKETRWTNDGKARIWTPKFVYFQKFSRGFQPPEVQRKSGGDTFVMTLWWDKPWEKWCKAGKPDEFAVFVGSDNKVEVLRLLRNCEKTIDSKPRKNGHKLTRKTTIPERKWIYPHKEWAEHFGLTPQLHLSHLFCGLVRSIDAARFTSMVRVAINKGDMTATFGVDIARMAYFFKDRDIIVNARGKRARVFHLVRPHLRKDGVAVKLHFRGERHFTWADYNVQITVPGYHHVDWNELSVGLVDESRVKDRNDLIYSAELGQWMVDQINEERGGLHSEKRISKIKDGRGI